MPELPEVETVRRIFDRVLVGKKIVEVEIPTDEIVLKGVDAEVVRNAILNRTVVATGRKGKYFWLQFEDQPMLFAHLGMAGWVRELGQSTIRLREHGNAPMDDAEGRPRFLKMLLTAEDGRRVAMTDGRRLSRIWLGDGPESDHAISKLGRDCYLDLPTAEELFALLNKRSAPIKAILLDQAVFAGVGNWIADEVLYMAEIRPSRIGKEISLEEVVKLHQAIQVVIGLAVEVGADKEQFPEDWLFHFRWGGAKGDEFLKGNQIIRETIGGRTTAWVPGVQK